MPRTITLADGQVAVVPDDAGGGPLPGVPIGTGPGHQIKLPGGPWVMVTGHSQVPEDSHLHLRPGEVWDPARNTIFAPAPAAPPTAPVPPPPKPPRGENWAQRPGDRRHHDGDILIEPGSLDSHIMDYADNFWNAPVKAVTNFADTAMDALNPISPMASVFADIAQATGSMDPERAEQLRHLSPFDFRFTDAARKAGWIYDPHGGWGRLGGAVGDAMLSLPTGGFGAALNEGNAAKAGMSLLTHTIAPDAVGYLAGEGTRALGGTEQDAALAEALAKLGVNVRVNTRRPEPPGDAAFATKLQPPRLAPPPGTPEARRYHADYNMWKYQRGFSNDPEGDARILVQHPDLSPAMGLAENAGPVLKAYGRQRLQFDPDEVVPTGRDFFLDMEKVRDAHEQQQNEGQSGVAAQPAWLASQAPARGAASMTFGAGAAPLAIRLPGSGQRSAAWLGRAGMPSDESHALLGASTSNPQALQPVLDYVGSQYGDEARRQFLNLRANAIVAGATSGGPSPVRVDAPEPPPPVYDWSQQDW